MDIVIPKALTLMQPHAWAATSYLKRFENRSRSMSHRGPLLIHAGVNRSWLNPTPTYPGQPKADDMVFGALVGIVNVVGCLSLDEAIDWHGRHECMFGPWCYEMQDRKAFVEPVPCRGLQGLWTPPKDLWGAILTEIARAVPAPEPPKGVAS